MIPLVDLRAQIQGPAGPEIQEAIQRIVTNTSFIMGKEVKDFEAAFAAYSKTSHAIGVASGTAALQLALLACGVRPGDEVITTSLTFAATVESIYHVGARPVLVDIDPVTFNLDPEKVADAITPQTKAILAVHLYGQPADLDPLLEIAQQHDLKLIEDAAQAHGAEYKGRRIGGIGDAACFSFYPGKNLGGFGDGGMVTTNDAGTAERVAMLRDHGRTSKYEHSVVGYGERLDALQAAILGVKLRYLEDWTEKRRQAADGYRVLLADSDLELPTSGDELRHVYHLFVVRVSERDKRLQDLQEAGIGAGIHYPIPMHLQPAFSDLGYRKGIFPQAEKAASEILSLPLFPEITEGQLQQVAEAAKKS